MALSSTNNKSIFTCDGATTDFDTDFKIFADADAEVILYTIADGTETTLTLTTHYTISLKTDSGFRVSTVSTYASTYKLIVRRKLSQLLLQSADWQRRGSFDTDVLEDGLDKRAMADLALYELISRVVLQDSSNTDSLTLPAASAGKVLGWADDGTLENNTLSDLGALSKASTADAEAGTNDAKYMTPAKVKSQVEAGAFSLPGSAITGYSTPATSIISINSLTEKSAPVGDDLILTGDSSASGAIKKVKVSSLGFQDRGDPAAYDFAAGDLTTDGTWNDLDLSSIVPAGAKAVVLRVSIVDGSLGYVYFRKNGNSNEYNMSEINNQVAEIQTSADITVALDSGRVIEYKASETTWTTLNIIVKGWFI